MILSADKNRYDPTVMNVFSGVRSTIPIVLITRIDDYEFNPELLKLKDWICADYVEYEWDKSNFKNTHIFGQNTHDFKYRFPREQWELFDKWVKNNPPKLYLKRELLEKDATEKIVSSTYPCFTELQPIQTREQFEARPIELFHYFGRSHEARIVFQGNAHLYSSKAGIDLVDNMYYLQGYLNQQGEHRRTWVSLHIPHFSRVDLSQLFKIGSLSKLGLSMPGCGKRCFRDSEIPVTSIPVFQDSGIDFPFKWVHGENCIMYQGDDPIPAIEAALKRTDLYEIYLNAQKNIANYQIRNYTRYLENLINSVL